MALSVYSSRFLAEKNFLGSQSFEVPVGFVAVVRDLDAYMNSLTGANIYFTGSADQIIDWGVQDVDTTVVHQWRGRQVFSAGETFAVVTTGNGVDFTVSGYLLADT